MPQLPPPIATDTLRFGPDARFELNLRQRSLLVDNETVAVGSRAFDLLAVLVERRAGVVSKNDLLDLVWPGSAVEEGNLHVHVSSLRKLLGAGAIATVPGRGYRFTEAVDVGPAKAPDAAPALATPLARTNLPAHPPALIGRSADLASLGALLDTSAFVTMVGSGGVGKTSLAQAVLHQRHARHAHGVCWVELSPVADAASVPGAVAAALGVHAAQGPAMPALVAALAPLAVLIALDNAEHLVEAVAAFARTLRAGAPHVRLLVTSQIPLRVAGERLYRVAPLGLPAPAADAALALQHGAVALFVERVQAIDRHFTLDAGNVATVVQLCRRLDGLALAIELAAARVPLLGLAQLTQALDQRLRVLTTGLRGAPARQRTLRAALEWSHGFLTAGEQAVFRRLAVFIGSTTLEMLQQVAAEAPAAAGTGGLDGWDVLEALAVLVERSLVVVLETEPPRYRLLESPRSHALDCLAAAGELAPMQRRHARALADRLAAAYPARWDGSVGVDAWRASLEPDLDNAREAFAWARANDPPTALAIVGPLLWAVPLALWSERMTLSDAAESLLIDPAVAKATPDAIRALAWLAIASARMRTRNRQGMAAARQARAVFDAVANDRGCYLALACEIDAAARANELAQADAALVELHTLADAT